MYDRGILGLAVNKVLVLGALPRITDS